MTSKVFLLVNKKNIIICMPSGAPKAIENSEGLYKALTFHGRTSQTIGEVPLFV